MKNKITKIFFLSFALVLTGGLRAQSLQPTVIASDGGFAVVTSGSISWTLGETITETFTSTNNFLTQGFQQPSVLLVSVVGSGGTNGVIVYPNPATNIININLNKLPSAEYTIELFDLLGNKVAVIGGVNSGIYSLPLIDIANGMYMLTVSSSGFSQSYKVIKSK